MLESTTQIQDEVQKKPVIEKKPKKNNNSTDIASQFEKLNKLYKSGALTKDEFEKAKKKLLN